MRGKKEKHVKLMATIAISALLSAGAAITGWAATGWQEDGDVWRWYDSGGDYVTDTWKKSENLWYYLDESGEMAVNRLIEDDGNYYYVDANGVMVTNRWIEIPNENFGDESEPSIWYYYFQDNGKGMKGPQSGKVALKEINGKEYAFDTEARMLSGWIKADDATLMLDDPEAWKTGDYYFGDENDGAMTIGWLKYDLLDEDFSEQKWINSAFIDEYAQSRWFYFMGNGKKVAGSVNDSGNTELKERDINGAKYGFDEYGRMVAEWSYDFSEFASPTAPGEMAAVDTYYDRDQAGAWMYFRSVDDGTKLARGWFKVVPAEYLNADDYDGETEGWYYTDGKGHLYTSQLQTIDGEKYAFDDKGKMISGLNFLVLASDNKTIDWHLKADNDYLPFDTEEAFDENAGLLVIEAGGFYYFGNEDDGAMKLEGEQVDLNGTSYPFYFRKAGSKKGAGLLGEDNDKLYNSGKLMQAGKDEKFQVVTNAAGMEGDGFYSYKGYWKFLDAEEFKTWIKFDGSGRYGIYEPQTWDKDDAEVTRLMAATGLSFDELKKATGLTSSKTDKYGEIVIYTTVPESGAAAGQKEKLGLSDNMTDWSSEGGDEGSYGYALVNTSGKMSSKNVKNKDGNEVCFKLYNGRITALYIEE